MSSSHAEQLNQDDVKIKSRISEYDGEIGMVTEKIAFGRLKAALDKQGIEPISLIEIMK